MRLLYHGEDGELSVSDDFLDEDDISPYAILSHSWGADEEMCDMPRRTRIVELPIHNQEGRDSQSKGRVQDVAALPPRCRDSGT